MQKKLTLRLALGLLAIAVLFAGFYAFQEFTKDPFLGSADTVEAIAAVEETREGRRVVLIDRDGEKRVSPEHHAGIDDREIAWRPDGNRILFSSNRGDTGAFVLFEWILNRDQLRQITTGTRSMGMPAMPMDTSAAGIRYALVIAGGIVLEVDMRERTTRQVLPPIGGIPGMGDEGGAVAQFSGVYGRLGDSFRRAEFGPRREFIYAVMRGSEGETFILQPLGDEPIPLIRGDVVDFSVDQNGRALVSVQGFRYLDPSQASPDEIIDGVIVPTIKHAVLIIDPEAFERGEFPTPAMPVVFSEEEDGSFGFPALSPDGSTGAIVTGTVNEQREFRPELLAVFPAVPGGLMQGSPLVRGPIIEPSWSPDGGRLTYIKVEGNERNVYTISRSGAQETRVARGIFSTPRFSPQRTTAP